jgi:hypothetical protein
MQVERIEIHNLARCGQDLPFRSRAATEIISRDGVRLKQACNKVIFGREKSAMKGQVHVMELPLICGRAIRALLFSRSSRQARHPASSVQNERLKRARWREAPVV